MILRSGLVVPARCDRTSCWACIVPVAISTGEAIAMAQPTQALTLTNLPRLWQGVRDRMTRFGRALRRRGVKGAYAYHVEPNPGDTDRTHTHVWFRGDHLDQSLLRDVAAASGMGRVVLEKAATPATTSYDVPTLDYGLKMVLANRPTDPGALWPSAETYLRLNGGKLVHATNSFWRSWGGEALQLRAARRLAHNGGLPRSRLFVAGAAMDHVRRP